MAQADRDKLIEGFTREARRLAESLTRKLEEPIELIPGYDALEDWLPPSRVAPLVGKSKRWVHDHVALFAGTRRDDNGYYMIPKKAVLRYLQTRTEAVEP